MGACTPSIGLQVICLHSFCPFPQPYLISKVLAHMEEGHEDGTLIIPHWLSQRWLPIVAPNGIHPTWFVIDWFDLEINSDRCHRHWKTQNIISCWILCTRRWITSLKTLQNQKALSAIQTMHFSLSCSLFQVQICGRYQKCRAALPLSCFSTESVVEPSAS